MTTFRYRLTLLCRVGLPRGPSPPYMRTIVTFLRFDTTLAGERSFFHRGGHLLTDQVAQWFTNTCLLDFAAFSPALACWTCCIFTSICLLDFSAFSPALAWWTCCIFTSICSLDFSVLKIRNRTVYFNYLPFLGLLSSIIQFPMQ